MIKNIATVICILICCFVGLSPAYSQSDTLNLETIADQSISEYDQYCPIMGGDSVRMENNQKATGYFKDFYPGGAIKHKGYYENGKIITVFKNYYENGQEERSFKARSYVRGILEVYYPNGYLLSRVEWVDGESQKWEDFYADGQLEFAEEYDKRLEYHIYMRFYYEDGTPKVLFELADEKERTYSYKEYYPQWKVKESGMKVQNANLGDYQMDGKWEYFDESGKLILEEEYHKGLLINDKEYR